MEVTKWLKPSISVSQIGGSASVQAATRVNAEQSSKRTMRRSTRQPYRGRLIRLDDMSEASLAIVPKFLMSSRARANEITMRNLFIESPISDFQVTHF